jgi:hypothetical protein
MVACRRKGGYRLGMIPQTTPVYAGYRCIYSRRGAPLGLESLAGLYGRLDQY